MRRKDPEEDLAQGDRLFKEIDRRISGLNEMAGKLERRKEKVSQLLLRLDDPHAVIPDRYGSMEEFMEHYEYPKTLLGLVCDNWHSAKRMQMESELFRDRYHIVRCRPMLYYAKMIWEKEKENRK